MNSSSISSGKTRETKDAIGPIYDILSCFALGKPSFALFKARLVPEGAVRVESRMPKSIGQELYLVATIAVKFLTLENRRRRVQLYSALLTSLDEPLEAAQEACPVFFGRRRAG